MGAQQLLLAVVTWFVLVKENVCTAVKCNSPGELIPNRENCRKYFKCSNGEPSLQSCPGTLIFDPVLKICNWPDSTTCISDLLVRPRAGADPGSSQFSKDILHALRAAAT